MELALAFSKKVASADNYLQQGDVERLGINFGLNNSELLRTDCSGGPKSYGPRSRRGPYSLPRQFSICGLDRFASIGAMSVSSISFFIVANHCSARVARLSRRSTSPSSSLIRSFALRSSSESLCARVIARSRFSLEMPAAFFEQINHGVPGFLRN